MLPPEDREKVTDLCQQIENDIFELNHLCGSGIAGGPDSARAVHMAAATADKLGKLKEAIRSALVDRCDVDIFYER